MRNLRANLPIVLLTGLAFFLRLHRLDALNLWYDEAFSLRFATIGLAEMIRNCLTFETNPPFYPFVLHFWVRIFGDSEFSLRFPSVLFGTACVPLAYALGARSLSRFAGGFAAIVVAASPFYIYFSQEARAYALFSFLCLSSIYFLEAKAKVLFAASLVLALWTHAFGVFLLVSLNIYQLLRLRGNGEALRGWVRLQVVIVVLSCPWYLAFLQDPEAYRSTLIWIESLPRPEFPGLLDTYTGFAAPWVKGGAALLCLPGLWRLRSANRKPLLFLTTWFLLSFAVPASLGRIWHPFLLPRHTIAASIGLLLVVGALLEWISHSSRALAGVLASLLLFQYGFSYEQYLASVKKTEWEKAFTTIIAGGNLPATVLISPRYHKDAGPEYYVRKLKARHKIKLTYDGATGQGNHWKIHVQFQVPSFAEPPRSESHFHGLRLEKL